MQTNVITFAYKTLSLRYFSKFSALKQYGNSFFKKIGCRIFRHPIVSYN